MNQQNIFFDIDQFDEEKISYIKPLMFYKSMITRSIGIYYQKEKKGKKQKIIIQSPKMFVPFDIKEFDNKGIITHNMSLSFNTFTNLYNEAEIKNFYNFVKTIDRINEETLQPLLERWGVPPELKYNKSLTRTSKDYPFHMNFRLPHDEELGFLFNVYDENAKKSNIEIIKKRSIVSVILELTDIKFTDDTYRTNWTIMQIRKFKPYSPIQEFLMSSCFICDKDDPEDTAYLQLIEKYNKTLQTPLNLPRIPHINSNQPSNPGNFPPPPPRLPGPPPPPINQAPPKPEQNVSIFVPPSADELQSRISMLKKVTLTKGEGEGKSKVDDKSKTEGKSKAKVDDKSNAEVDNKSKTEGKSKAKVDDKSNAEVISNTKDRKSKSYDDPNLLDNSIKKNRTKKKKKCENNAN